MLYLIADSGSTKTDWNLVETDGRVLITCQSQGLNPYHLHEDEILRILDEDVKVPLLNKIGEALAGPLMVFFYGSGITDAMKPKMEALLHTSFPEATCIAESDMLGAARALLGREQGVAVILGTGSNSCFYDGVNIVQGVPPLGYILGDEGSGTAIGKDFLRLILREPDMSAVKERFFAWAGMDYAGIIDRVYRQPLANRFLASISTFVGELLQGKADAKVGLTDEEYKLLKGMLVQVFRDFVSHILCSYSLAENAVGFVGSIAFYFQEFIRTAMEEAGMKMGVIMRSPMEGLLRYHSSNSPKS